MRIGSLFSGYGGLDMGVQAVLGGEVAWHVEYDEAPSRILKHHWPAVPNYGDITKVDWTAVPPVDILTGGFPCQDLSLAGRRKGMRPGTRSGLWADFAKAIDQLRPSLVVIENVRGLLSGCAESETDSELGPCPRCADPDSGAKHAPNVRALGRVLIDLARIGYDARWVGLRASDAGAPHERFRVFVAAYPAHIRPNWTGHSWDGRDGSANHHQLVADPRGVRSSEGNPAAERGTEIPNRSGVAVERGADDIGTDWGEFESAVTRWGNVLGRPAPAPRVDGRLSAVFGEWFMGLPAGWVTDPRIELSWNARIKALGNGVVPQQAALAVRTLLEAS